MNSVLKMKSIELLLLHTLSLWLKLTLCHIPRISELKKAKIASWKLQSKSKLKILFLMLRLPNKSKNKLKNKIKWLNRKAKLLNQQMLKNQLAKKSRSQKRCLTWSQLLKSSKKMKILTATLTLYTQWATSDVETTDWANVHGLNLNSRLVKF